MRILQKFAHDNSGAITVEFVVLGAVVTSVSIGVLLILAPGFNARATEDSAGIATTEERNQTAIDLMLEGVENETASD